MLSMLSVLSHELHVHGPETAMMLAGATHHVSHSRNQFIQNSNLTERHTVLGVGRHAAPHDKMEVGTCVLLDFQAGSAAGIHNPRLGNNRMRKQGERGGAELRLALS